MYGTLVSVENTMDREHIKGATDKAKGAIKETAGKMTRDEKLRAEGKLDKAKGAAHKAAGDMKEAAHPGSMHQGSMHQGSAQQDPTHQGSTHQGSTHPGPTHHGAAADVGPSPAISNHTSASLAPS